MRAVDVMKKRITTTMRAVDVIKKPITTTMRDADVIIMKAVDVVASTLTVIFHCYY
jgi:hypothetical protein